MRPISINRKKKKKKRKTVSKYIFGEKQMEYIEKRRRDMELIISVIYCEHN